jgi:ribosomal protein S18 acetylase RimI-like enzyme
MAGQRFRPDGFVEISAVCTDPDARQRGYAAALTRCNVDQIRAEGRQALLHTRFDNEAARRLYEAMGFVFRRQIAVVVARKIGEPSTTWIRWACRPRVREAPGPKQRRTIAKPRRVGPRPGGEPLGPARGPPEPD